MIIESTEQKKKSKPIQVLISFFGDYNAEIQFDGQIQENIIGLNNESTDFKSDKDCEISASFQDVLYLKSRHLKIQFFANCQSLNPKNKKSEKIILNPEYVRLKDLKTVSNGFYLSNAHKNVQFKIKDLKF